MLKLKTAYKEIEKRMKDSFDWNGDKWHYISVQGLAMVFDLKESTVKKIIKKWNLEKKNTLVQGTFQNKVGTYYRTPYFAK